MLYVDELDVVADLGDGIALESQLIKTDQHIVFQVGPEHRAHVAYAWIDPDIYQRTLRYRFSCGLFWADVLMGNKLGIDHPGEVDKPARLPSLSLLVRQTRKRSLHRLRVEMRVVSHIDRDNDGVLQ